MLLNILSNGDKQTSKHVFSTYRAIISEKIQNNHTLNAYEYKQVSSKNKTNCRSWGWGGGFKMIVK